jgi:hypothetical protein
MAQSSRGRPVIVEKAEIALEDGTSIVVRLVHDGGTAQIEMPQQWNLTALSRSVTKRGGKTKLTFEHEKPE